MTQFTTAEIERLLLAIDKRLKKPFVITIIGGAAAALAYKAVDYTRDIDTSDDLSEIEAAYDKAVNDTGLKIPLSPAGVWDGPHDLDSRLCRHKLAGLRMLTIMVPEKHDWVLMKVARGYEHDLTMIEDLKKRQGLDLELLIDRFNIEMAHVTGDRRRLELNLLAAIGRVFGEEDARRAENLIASKKIKSRGSI